MYCYRGGVFQLCTKFQLWARVALQRSSGATIRSSKLNAILKSRRRLRRGPRSRKVDAVYHRSGFAVLLVVVTFVPPLISVCSAFHAFHSAMKQMESDSPEAPGSEGSDSAKTPRSSEATVKGPDRVEDDEEQQKPAP